MSIKIFHTGDIHIGMKFNNYGDNVRELLIDARFLSLENMINKSNELECNIFLFSWDLFNAININKGDIKKVVDILNKFNGEAVLVLPGNHDYDNGINDLWRYFVDISGDKIILLNEKRPYLLDDYDLDIAIYPAPCHNKHSSENSINWIKENGLVENKKHHIGIAHGALEGLSADIEGNYYYMSKRELEDIPVDLWLIGHTHVRYPYVDEIKNNQIYNAGTPEPDGMDYKDEGSAFFIEVDNDNIFAKRIITGKYRFIDKDFEIDSKEDLENIEKFVFENKPEHKIIRLNLSGSLNKDLYNSLSDFYRELESGVFSLVIEDFNLKEKITKETIEKEFTRGSFPYEFLNKLIDDEEALQIAYELIRR